MLFSLACCDREVMGWLATTGGIAGEMVRDLMSESLEHRFGAAALNALDSIQWLSDNGRCYTARATCEFGRSLGPSVCTGPGYLPESNGMAEAFVKTFKRDYVYLNRLPAAAAVIAQLPGWFADYNEIHPHKGLGMRSPREYRRALSWRAGSRGSRNRDCLRVNSAGAPAAVKGGVSRRAPHAHP